MLAGGKYQDILDQITVSPGLDGTGQARVLTLRGSALRARPPPELGLRMRLIERDTSGPIYASTRSASVSKNSSS